jgi:hypothetical protein
MLPQFAAVRQSAVRIGLMLTVARPGHTPKMLGPQDTERRNPHAPGSKKLNR